MSSPPEQPENTLDRIMGERREKAAALRAHGSDPFRNDLGPSIGLAELRARYEHTKPAPPPPKDPGAPDARPARTPITPVDDQSHRVAGRVMVIRDKKKIVFAPIRDGHAEVQLFLGIDYLAADDFTKIVPQLDAGDLVVAEGPVFWSQTSELSVLVKRLWIVS
jgi:lysyl-tRNA synthetase class 2